MDDAAALELGELALDVDPVVRQHAARAAAAELSPEHRGDLHDAFRLGAQTSRRAAITSCTVPGMRISSTGRVSAIVPVPSRTRCPSSSSERVISSAKNGLPSALRQITRSSSRGSGPPATAWMIADDVVVGRAAAE